MCLERQLEKRIKESGCKKVKTQKKQQTMDTHYCPPRAFWMQTTLAPLFKLSVLLCPLDPSNLGASEWKQNLCKRTENVSSTWWHHTRREHKNGSTWQQVFSDLSVCTKSSQKHPASKSSRYIKKSVNSPFLSSGPLEPAASTLPKWTVLSPNKQYRPQQRQPKRDIAALACMPQWLHSSVSQLNFEGNCQFEDLKIRAV